MRNDLGQEKDIEEEINLNLITKINQAKQNFEMNELKFKEKESLEDADGIHND